MTDFTLDGLDRARLDWPEPLLIDLLSECYGEVPNASDRTIIARLHVHFLHELIEGEPRSSAFLRVELIACCAARGVGLQAIENADDAAFRELNKIVEVRFRNSSRMRQYLLEKLDDATGRLPARAAPRPRPATVRLLASARENRVLSSLPAERRLVVNG